jgi:hypothetical protein
MKMIDISYQLRLLLLLLFLSPLPDPASLPASTAPPRLQQEGTEIEGKRKRKHTKKYELAREQDPLTLFRFS